MLNACELNFKAPVARSLFSDENDTRLRSIAERLNYELAVYNDALSDDLTGFFIRQLTEIEPTFFQVLYKTLNGMTLFPSSSAYNIAAENILFQVWDYRGEARTIANYDVDDFPEADAVVKQLSVVVKGEGAGFSYTIQDLRAAKMANQPLDQMKTQAAQRTIEQKVNKVIWHGDALTLRVGVLTDPDVPYGSVPADGTGSSTTFAKKTGVQIYRDLCDCVREISDNSAGIFQADTLVLPAKQYKYIEQKLLSDTSPYQGYSVLSAFKLNNPKVTVLMAEELKAASSITPNNDVMIAYEKNPLYSTIAIPISFEMFPPQLQGMRYKIPCHARLAGMIIRQPLSMNIKEGI